MLAVWTGFARPGRRDLHRHASRRHWHRERANTSARTCATAFTRRLLYNRGTPGIVMPVAPTARGASHFGVTPAGKPQRTPITDAVTKQRFGDWATDDGLVRD